MSELLAHHAAAAAPPLLDSGSAAGASTQVVQLGSTDTSVAQNFDPVNARAMKRECPLDANPVGRDSANGEILVDSAAAATNHNAFVGLNPLSSTLDDFVMHANVIAGAKVRDLIFQKFLFDLPDCIDHGSNLPDVSVIKCVKQQEAAPRATNGF
jgi:hypothetical protein